MQTYQCSVFGTCGGCNQLNVPYSEQLEQKDQSIHELFDSMASSDAFSPILGMENPIHYRNKITSPFVRTRKKKGAKPQILTGMYGQGTHKVIPNDGCILENEIGQKIIAAIKRIMLKHHIEPYNEDTGEGFLRHVIVRVGHNSGEVLVVLVINSKEFPYAKSFCKELKKAVPQITSIVANVNLRQTNVILGEQEHTLYGPGFILDTICGLSFRISGHSFYQVNSEQTEVLYEAAINMAHLTSKDTLLDAYCGTGTIGLVAAKRSGCKLIGFDSAKSAIKDAKLNAKHNGIEYAEFVCCDDDTFFNEFSHKLQDTSHKGELVVMMDPPRSGATEQFLREVCAVKPQRIVYVSCNPQTQARDAQYLLEHGYAITKIQPVDMFPHTSHIENIVAFEMA